MDKLVDTMAMEVDVSKGEVVVVLRQCKQVVLVVLYVVKLGITDGITRNEKEGEVALADYLCLLSEAATLGLARQVVDILVVEMICFEECYVATVVEDIGQGSLLGQCGEGHIDKEDDVILEERYPFLNLSSGDVAHAVLEADASVGEVNTGLLQFAVRHGSTVIGGWKTARSTVIGRRI